MNEAKKPNNAPLFIGLAAIVAIGIGLAYAQRLLRPPKDPQTTAETPAKTTPTGPALVSDAERAAYIAQHITVQGPLVDPDTQIGPDGNTITIAGLLKAHGSVKNNGDKAIEKLILVLNPLDAEGKVLGSHREDITLNRRLNPQEERAFQFRIPDKKEYSGEYQHRVE